MLVCWEWLEEYVTLSKSPEDMALLFAMSGLNHEGTEQVGSDVVIDLEVTSNRGDCLGHLGVAREAAVLLDNELKLPECPVEESAAKASDSLEVENKFTDGCPEYTARIIRGVKIGPSPDWLVRRLKSIGINSVNNVVDVTNYVMMECGQPLHAFDLSQIRGNKIIVRAAEDKEKFEAIDHKAYELDSQMVVIADAERAVALGGVMGGVDSEVSESTTDLLIEAARFTPLSIRRAARKLKLHSPSSYRFERTPDPLGLDWASRRCCQLIAELAGGTLEAGIVSDGNSASERETIEFRLNQIPRVLGIDVPSEQSERILTALGCNVTGSENILSVTPPSWRPDLERECDLIEEVARIYGYEKIPENVAVPIGVAAPRMKDIALGRARLALSTYGVDEAMTPSVVGKKLEKNGSVWSNNPPLSVDTPLLEGAKLLRRSIVPSLLACRYTNQTQSQRNAELYEVATIYCPANEEGGLPEEQSTLGIVVRGDIQRIKGIVEDIISETAGRKAPIEWQLQELPLFENETGQKIKCGDQALGYLGLVNSEVQGSFSLEQPVAAAELSVDALTNMVQPVRRADPVSAFPAMSRDLNFVVSEETKWANLQSLCVKNGGENLRSVEYQETYRDAKKDGSGMKRTLLTLHFQSLERTLTGEEVDVCVQTIIKAAEQELAAKLLG